LKVYFDNEKKMAFISLFVCQNHAIKDLIYITVILPNHVASLMNKSRVKSNSVAYTSLVNRTIKRFLSAVF